MYILGRNLTNANTVQIVLLAEEIKECMKEVMKDIVVIIQSENTKIDLDINLNSFDQPYLQDLLEGMISTKKKETKQQWIKESYGVS
jgi:D-ribose pyranose/furanose isomerase RbsD